MLILQLTLPSAPRLAPDALTTLGNLEVSKCLFVSFLNISPDMMLLVAPVSNSVLMLWFCILVKNIVPT